MKRKSGVLREDLASLLEKYASSDVVSLMQRQYAKTVSQSLPLTQIIDNRRLQHFVISPLEIEKAKQALVSQRDLGPFVVRPLADKFEIILGRRRFYAAKQLGITSLTVIIQTYTDVEMLLTLLASMRESRETNALQLATVAHALHIEFGYSQQALGLVAHMSRPTMANFLRLLKLPEDMQQLVNDGRLSYGHARALITVAPSTQATLVAETLKHQWSVRRLETAIILTKLDHQPDQEILSLAENDIQINIKKRQVKFTFKDEKDVQDFIKRLQELNLL